MTEDGYGEELSAEQDIENKISGLEETFGEIIPRHREILEEEEDALKKLDIAKEILENSEKVTGTLARNGKNRDEMNQFMETGFKHIIALLRAVEAEIDDIHEKVEEENREITNLYRMEDEVREQTNSLLDHHEAIFGERLNQEGEHDEVDNLAKRYQRKNAEEAKQELKNRLDHYWDGLLSE